MIQFMKLSQVLLGVTILHGLAATGWANEPPSFVRDIRPILTRHCYTCHGPDEAQREAELRLDVRAAAVEAGAITAGEPEDSELLRRIFIEDPDERMPPADAGTKLSQREQKLLHDWVAAGAEYQEHWAFVRPTRPAPPDVKRVAWPRNDIDQFVLARIEEAEFQAAPEADRYTLIRRLYLDLIGLPPSIAEADAFVADEDPRAYERLVTKLIESDHYGERWARQWLDLARYSDTNGYEKDRPRSIWPFRDWVIKALNDDMPFDRFTIKQLAGDMLLHATDSQRIATGFHRNTMLNEEGGIDPLEFRFYAMVDRVATTGTVWMGLTTGCAQCHSHKYDPLSQTDYYRLMALLNNADEPDLVVRDPTIVARQEVTTQKIVELEAALAEQFPPTEGDQPLADRRRQALETKFAAWIEAQSPTAWTVLRSSRMETNLPKLEILTDGSIYSSGDITKRDLFTLSFPLVGLAAPVTALRLEVLPDARLPAGGPGRAFYEGRKGDFFLSEVVATAGDQPAEFNSGSHSFGKISIGSGNANAANVFDGDGSTGWATAGREGESHQLVLRFAKLLDIVGELTIEMVFERHFAASLGRFRVSATSQSGAVSATALPVEVETLLAQGVASWTPAQQQQIQQHYLRAAPELAEARKKIDQLRKTLPEFPTSMVMQERPADNPRKTTRHHRGEYVNPREEVTGGLPELFVNLDHDGGVAAQFPTDRNPFAAYTIFDGPTGENCTSRRDRSNTPLQALTLLNDEMFLELARGLARQTIASLQAADLEPDERDEVHATALFRHVITRPPTDAELAALLQYYHAQRKRFVAGELDAAKIGSDESASADMAAWVMTARTIMNLDEAITKE